MIKPTVGRVVLIRRRACAIYTDQPEAAFITYVFGDRMINVGGFNANGTSFGETSVPLLQDDDVPNSLGTYAEWMPYQKGQAAKTDALELAAAARAAGPTSY